MKNMQKIQQETTYWLALYLLCFSRHIHFMSWSFWFSQFCVAEQRTKEIGIRKVIGASVFNIWNLLSNEFIGLVIISLLIASPIAYFCNEQLGSDKYTYHTSISCGSFSSGFRSVNNYAFNSKLPGH
jgi:hypothetical protein